MATFGKTDVGGTKMNWTQTHTYACRYQLTEDGTLTGISVYNDDATPEGTVRMAIYDESGGLPNNIVVGPTDAQAAVTGWNTVSGLSVALSAGYYWIAAYWTIVQTLGRAHDAGASGQLQVRLATEFPDPFGTPDAEADYAVSIYATYTPSVVVGGVTNPYLVLTLP